MLTHCIFAVLNILVSKKSNVEMHDGEFRYFQEVGVASIICSPIYCQTWVFNHQWFAFQICLSKYFRKFSPLTWARLPRRLGQHGFEIYFNFIVPSLKVNRDWFQLLTTYILLKLWVHFIPHFRSIKTDIYGPPENN